MNYLVKCRHFPSAKFALINSEFFFLDRCSCNAEYALAADGRTCVDIDECILQTDACNDLAVCSNTVGSYTCSCQEGKKTAASFNILFLV